MKRTEIQTMMERIDKWHKFDDAAGNMTKAINALEQISGNSTEVRPVTLRIITYEQTDICLCNSGLTNWEVRQALLPLIEAKRKQLLEAMEKL